MGEKKQKSRRRQAILEGEARCIYCTSIPTTVEHMPPIAMFPNNHRLSGMEFAACEECNQSTRAADAAAAFVARIAPTNRIDETEHREARKLFGTLVTLAPDFHREFLDDRKSEWIWERGRDPFYGKKRRIRLDGPIATDLLRTFSAKVGMALYREHVGEALPTNGLVFTEHYANAGLFRDEVERLLSIMSIPGQLKQGSKVSGRHFNYRFNTDGKTRVGAFVAFNDNFFVRVFATHEAKLIEALSGVHDYPPVSVGGLKSLTQTWRSTD